MLSGLILSSILTLTPVWSSKEWTFTWYSMGEGYEYVLEVYSDRELTQIYDILPPTSKIYLVATYYDTGLYFHRVKYYHIDTPEQYTYEYLGQIYVNLEEGYVSEDAPYQTEEEEKEKEPLPPPKGPLDNGSAEIKQASFLLSKNIDYREKILPEILASTESIKKSSESKECNISIVKGEITKIKDWDCDMGFSFTDIKYLNWFKYNSLEIEGKYQKNIKANIKVYECMKFSIINSDSWGKCKELLVDSYKGDIKFTYSGYISVNGVKREPESFDFRDSTFSLRNTFKDDIYGNNVKLHLTIYSQFKSTQWYDFTHTVTKVTIIPKIKPATSQKPFSFPLDRLIGVTQWHGCTQYQCPHKGIDFGAKLNRVIAIGDGVVVNLGYDKYGGECNQGGNFVIVKHSNGMHSAYIHLESFAVKKNQKVKKGDLIGISGNTGRKNCQPLKYHLHFEVRKGLNSSTHLNPVNFVDVDWASIPTLGYKQSPGRLGGDNPHPGY